MLCYVPTKVGGYIGFPNVYITPQRCQHFKQQLVSHSSQTQFVFFTILFPFVFRQDASAIRSTRYQFLCSNVDIFRTADAITRALLFPFCLVGTDI